MAAGYTVAADCGARGKCGRCKIKVLEGAGALPLTSIEARRLDAAEAARGLRLACQHEAVDGVVLQVLEELYRQEVYKKLGIGLGQPLPCHPAIRTVPLGGGEIDQSLAQAGLPPEVDWLAVLPEAAQPQAPAAARAALVSEPGGVIGLAGAAAPRFGAAVDLGTSTIAVYLCNLQTGEVPGVETARNPQISFGADVMSRITAGADHQNAAVMAGMARETIAVCIQTLCRRYDLAPRDLVEALVVGNSTMCHLLLGAPVPGLGLAPYRPVFHEGLRVRARDLGLPLHPGALVHTLPLPSAFVGADTVAAWLWADRRLDDRPTLLLDLGTNGEMVLAAGGRLWATSCATGPAFEGATLSCGMAGIPGAIEQVAFRDGVIDLKVIGSSTDPAIRPRGLCGSGAMSALAALLSCAILRADGRFEPGLGPEALRQTPAGVEFMLASAEQAANGQAVVLHQKDVRELQLAKAAVATGIKFLCAAAGIKAPERIFLAGAFGNVLEPRDAVAIGMIPAIASGHIDGIGNAAGLGAALALLDVRARGRAGNLLHELEVIELGGAPGFKEAFFASLAFPDRSQAFHPG